MKKKILLLLLAAALALGAAGCDEAGTSQSDTIPETSATTAQTTQTESTAEPIKYNGTFNDEVFNQIVQNIKIGDKTISLPCTLEDFGEGYEYNDEGAYYQEDAELRSCSLLYNDNLIATVTIKCKEDDKNFTDNEIYAISFWFSDLQNPDGINDISIGGVMFDNTIEKVLGQFGEPSKKNKRSSGTTKFYYNISSSSGGNGNLNYLFNADGKVIDMGITLPIS